MIRFSAGHLALIFLFCVPIANHLSSTQKSDVEPKSNNSEATESTFFDLSKLKQEERNGLLVTHKLIRDLKDDIHWPTNIVEITKRQRISKNERNMHKKRPQGLRRGLMGHLMECQEDRKLKNKMPTRLLEIGIRQDSLASNDSTSDENPGNRIGMLPNILDSKESFNELTASNDSTSDENPGNRIGTLPNLLDSRESADEPKTSTNDVERLSDGMEQQQLDMHSNPSNDDDWFDDEVAPHHHYDDYYHNHGRGSKNSKKMNKSSKSSKSYKSSKSSKRGSSSEKKPEKCEDMCPDPNMINPPCAPKNLNKMCNKYEGGNFADCWEACTPSFCCIHDSKRRDAPTCSEKVNCEMYNPCYIIWWKLHDTIGPAPFTSVEQNDDFFNIDDTEFATALQKEENEEFAMQLFAHHFDDDTLPMDSATFLDEDNWVHKSTRDP